MASINFQEQRAKELIQPPSRLLIRRRYSASWIFLLLASRWKPRTQGCSSWCRMAILQHRQQPNSDTDMYRWRVKSLALCGSQAPPNQRHIPNLAATEEPNTICTRWARPTTSTTCWLACIHTSTRSRRLKISQPFKEAKRDPTAKMT